MKGGGERREGEKEAEGRGHREGKGEGGAKGTGKKGWTDGRREEKRKRRIKKGKGRGGEGRQADKLQMRLLFPAALGCLPLVRLD